MNTRSTLLAAALITALNLGAAQAQFQAGRPLGDRNTFMISLTLGMVQDLDGEVRESTRPIETIGGPTSGSPPENYSWRELGFDDSFALYGVHMEKLWRYFTLYGRVRHGVAKLSGTADRDYYIGVESIPFGARDYEYMKIPEGTAYDGEIDIFTLDFGLRFIPFSITTPEERLTIAPWLHLGLFGFIGDYEINAGPATGVIQYENPPRDYVVRGRGTGTAGIVMPEIGFGGEINFKLTDKTAINLQGNWGILKYNGSTGDFGISTRNEKAVDIDYTTISARLLLETAINDSMDLVIGVEVQSWEADASVKAKDKPDEVILALREKFDKDILFTMNTVMGFIGIRW